MSAYKKSHRIVFPFLFILVNLVFASSFAQVWQPLGPGPLLGGQSEGIVNTPVIGAIEGFATHPTNPDIIYVASVNGGIWKTTNATAASPSWTPLTDDQESLSMSDIEFDLADNSHQTLVAAFGRTSSLVRIGGSRAGLIKTTDGGSTWSPIGGMSGRNINSVIVNGSTLLTAVDIADNFSCPNIGVFKSTDSGSNWTQTMNLGSANAMVFDPHNPSTVYAGVHTFDGVCVAGAKSGIYKSTDTGSTWTKVNDGAMETIIGSNDCHYEVAIGPNSDTVFVAMACQGELAGVFRSTDGAGTWTAMDIPTTTENGVAVGIHPGKQGGLHFSLAADPNNADLVYIGGDRQPGSGVSPTFPNSIGANDFSGRLFRGDASQPTNSQWTPLTHNGTASNSAPHADSRELQFDLAGSLLESDDGGIYRRNNPTSTSGDWISVNGNLQVNEQHDTAYDKVSDITISGNQDNGSSAQSMFANQTWSNYSGGDGGDVVVDTLSLSASNESIRYVSFQNLGSLRRLTFDASNNFQGTTFPNLTVVNGGTALDPQFVTPLAINNLNGNRLIIGAKNSVYESLDKGDTVNEIGSGIRAQATGKTSIAYGATGNEEILYIAGCIGSCFDNADGLDGVFVRTTSGGALNHVFTASNSNTVVGVVINPTNPAEAFIIENARVLRTTDTGSNWTDITDALAGFGTLRSIAFMPNATDSGLAVGGDKGVYISRSSGGYSNWSSVSSGLPNALVFDLHYEPSQDRLIAGTMGRGAFAFTGVFGDNSAPIAGDDSINLAKGATATTLVGGSNTLLNNDTDSDTSDQLTVNTIPTKQPLNGLLNLNSDGTFSYQHDGSLTNSDEFFYRVCDDGTPSFCDDGKVDVTIDLGSIECSTPNQAIPDDGGTTSLTNMLTINSSGTISDINVGLEISHTWIGDLVVSLKNMNTQTSVVLLNRPNGGANGNVGSCDKDNISVTLDADTSNGAVNSQCEPTPPAISGVFTPVGDLSVFNGEELSGNWELTVTDHVNVDTGALISWCIEPTVSASTAAPVLAAIGNQTVDELTELTFTATATDADTAQSGLSFSLSGAPAGAAITTAGVFSFTPTEAQGPGVYSFDVVVSDGANNDSETIQVTVNEVNQSPILDPIGNKTVNVLDTLEFQVTGSDSDLPAQNLSFSLVGAPTGATITPQGLFSFTPSVSQGQKTFTFDVVISDDFNPAGISSETIEVQVTDLDLIFRNGFEL